MGFSERLQLIIGSDARTKFASKCGIGENSLRQYLSGSIPGIDKAVAIAKAGNVTLEWLITGNGPMRRGDADSDFARNYVLIPQMSHVEAAAGHGLEVISEEPDKMTAFRREWITNTMELDPDRLALIKVSGDSMTPTLNDGDLIMVDMRENHRMKSDAIYCIHDDNGLRVKRLQRLNNGTVLIKSDNPTYDTETIDSDDTAEFTFKICGRVVWAGRRM